MELVDILKELAKDLKEGERKFFAYSDIRQGWGENILGPRPSAEIEKAAKLIDGYHIKNKKSNNGVGVEIFKMLNLTLIDNKEFL